jgi:protein SCO1/2
MSQGIHNLRKISRYCTAMIILVAAALSGSARANDSQIAASGDQIPQAYRNVGVVEHLNRELPLDERFYDESGQYITLRQLLKPNRPILLQLGYLECPMLCDVISRSLVDSVKKINLDIGKDFDFVFVSIDPTDTPTLATLKRNSYVTEYDKAGSAGGFHILVGKPNQIAAITNAVGYGFKAAQNGQFAHPAVAMVITPEGKISRYLYPPSDSKQAAAWFPEQTLRLSLVEASHGNIGTTVDQVLLICLQYDPTAGKYTYAAMNLMRVGGILTMMALGSAVFWMVRRGHRTMGEIPPQRPSSLDAPEDDIENRN